MVPLDELRKDIEKESRSEREKIAKETDKEVDEMIGQAKQRADSIMKGARKEIEAEKERRRKEIEASTEIEANVLLLAAKEAVIDRSLKEVKGLIAKEISESHMKEVIHKAAESFADAVPKEDITVVLDKSNAELANGLGFKVQHADIEGFELYSSDRRIMLDGSADKIAGQHSDTIRSILSESLFHKGKQTRQGAKPARRNARKMGKK